MASTTILPSLTLDLAVQTVTYAQSYCISAVLCVVMFRAPTGRSHQHHHLLCWLAHSRWPYRSVAFDPSVETFSVAQSGLEPLSLPSLRRAPRSSRWKDATESQRQLVQVSCGLCCRRVLTIRPSTAWLSFPFPFSYLVSCVGSYVRVYHVRTERMNRMA